MNAADARRAASDRAIEQGQRRATRSLSTEDSPMTLDNSAEFDAGHVLTSFAADLTDAAYSVVLRHGIGGSWIDLQLDVWRVLAASITETPRPESRSPAPGEFYAWR